MILTIYTCKYKFIYDVPGITTIMCMYFDEVMQMSMCVMYKSE